MSRFGKFLEDNAETLFAAAKNDEERAGMENILDFAWKNPAGAENYVREVLNSGSTVAGQKNAARMVLELFSRLTTKPSTSPASMFSSLLSRFTQQPSVIPPPAPTTTASTPSASFLPSSARTNVSPAGAQPQPSSYTPAAATPSRLVQSVLNADTTMMPEKLRNTINAIKTAVNSGDISGAETLASTLSGTSSSTAANNMQVGPAHWVPGPTPAPTAQNVLYFLRRRGRNIPLQFITRSLSQYKTPILVAMGIAAAAAVAFGAYKLYNYIKNKDEPPKEVMSGTVKEILDSLAAEFPWIRANIGTARSILVNGVEVGNLERAVESLVERATAAKEGRGMRKKHRGAGVMMV